MPGNLRKSQMHRRLLVLFPYHQNADYHALLYRVCFAMQ